MAGSIDKVENVFLAITVAVVNLNGMALDGNAPLTLQFHVIENLVLHVALRECVGHL